MRQILRSRVRQVPGRDLADAKNWPCACGHVYVAHRCERHQLTPTVCGECRCVRFTPRDRHAWQRLLRKLAGKHQEVC